jgi:hypothetical protein
MYVFGGETSKNVPVTDPFWSFDLKANKWERIMPASDATPQPRFAHSAVISPVNGKMVLFGGSMDKSKHFNDIWEYSFGKERQKEREKEKK